MIHKMIQLNNQVIQKAIQVIQTVTVMVIDKIATDNIMRVKAIVKWMMIIEIQS